MVRDISIGISSGFEDKLPCPDLSSLYFADDKAQQLFDNCFILSEVSSSSDIEDDFISSIYPNPFSLNSSNQCFVTSSSELKSVKIFDLFGNFVYKSEGLLKTTSSNNNNQFTYELGTKNINILSGLYFIVLEDKNYNSVIKKWLVN
ncbi:MAG: T9SS type A sorting domain-containing protein [Saprospiraceae bacterium]|nr:T9SS type A sorting domain-containing protein [Saprospiraceae bacterium]